VSLALQTAFQQLDEIGDSVDLGNIAFGEHTYIHVIEPYRWLRRSIIDAASD
jgi:hypothetical protein